MRKIKANAYQVVLITLVLFSIYGGLALWMNFPDVSQPEQSIVERDAPLDFNEFGALNIVLQDWQKEGLLSPPEMELKPLSIRNYSGVMPCNTRTTIAEIEPIVATDEEEATTSDEENIPVARELRAETTFSAVDEEEVATGDASGIPVARELHADTTFSAVYKVEPTFPVFGSVSREQFLEDRAAFTPQASRQIGQVGVLERRSTKKADTVRSAF